MGNKGIVGVDVGGSHVTACLVDPSSRQIHQKNIVRNRVDSHAPAEIILNLWCKTIIEVTHNAGVPLERIGFAMPGPFDYENGICLIKGFDKYEALYNWNIRTELSQRLSIAGADILFRNDAEAFLDGELFCGAAIGYSHAVGITLGTGLGSATSHCGHTFDAELSILDYKGEKVEECVSTRGLLRNYFQLTGTKLSNAKELSDRFDTDENARKTFQKFADDLSWFLNIFVNKQHPEVIVVGGNIANAWELFMPRVIENLSQSLDKMPNIKPAELGENAAMIGGACHFLSPALANRL